MPANFENSAVPTELKKVSFHANSQKKTVAKECSNYHTVMFISHASRVMLKILQARLQQFNPWVRKIPWRMIGQPTPGFLPAEFHAQRSLVGSQRVGHD